MTDSNRLSTVAYGTAYYTLASVPDLTVGILISGKCKLTQSAGGYPWSKGNDVQFSVYASNWQWDGITGNVGNCASATDCNYNANSQMSVNGAWVADYSWFGQSGMPEDQALGWVWACWQVIVNGANDLVFRQWLKFGDAGNLIFSENIVTRAALRTLSGDAAWTPATATSLSVGQNSGYANDRTRLRIEQYGSLPSDAKLNGIFYNDTADTGTWADYDFNWVSGAPVVTDRSGNGRTLTSGGGTFYQGAVTPTIPTFKLRQSPAIVWANQDSGTTLAALGSALSGSFGALPTSGSVLVCEGIACDNAGTLGITDNQSGSWTIVQNAPASGTKCFVAYCIAPSGSGTYTVTATGLGTAGAHIQLSEWTGNSATQPDWSVSPATDTAGYTITAPSADTANGVLLVLAIGCSAPYNTAYAPGASVVVGNFVITGGNSYDQYAGRTVRKIIPTIATNALTVPAPSGGTVSGVMVGFTPLAGAISVAWLTF